MGHQQGQVLVRALSTMQIAIFSSYHHMVEKSKRALWGPFFKGTNLIHEGSTFMTSVPPKGPTPNTVTVEVRISAYQWGGGRAGAQTSVSMQSILRAFLLKRTPIPSDQPPPPRPHLTLITSLKAYLQIWLHWV